MTTPVLAPGTCRLPALGTTAVLVTEDPHALTSAARAIRRILTAIDRTCSRFRADSEISRLHERAGHPTTISPLLAQALDVAIRTAEITDGLVDPTVGAALLALGYDRDFLGATPRTPRRPLIPGSHHHPDERASMDLKTWAVDTTDAALGRRHRPDEVLGRTGGPAGNAKLTAWTGLVLLIFFLAELVTLLDVHGLLSWHVVIGTLLVPPALLKTVTTGWRMVGYYLGNQPYRRSGPPPMPLRLLGPLVVASTLAVLGTGVALVLIGPAGSRNDLLDVAGFGVGLLMLHKASFLVWAVATGLHLLARTVPALRLTVLSRAGGPVAGRTLRLTTLALTMAVAAVAAVLILSQAGPWRTERDLFHHRSTTTAPNTHRRLLGRREFRPPLVIDSASHGSTVAQHRFLTPPIDNSGYVPEVAGFIGTP